MTVIEAVITSYARTDNMIFVRERHLFRGADIPEYSADSEIVGFHFNNG